MKKWAFILCIPLLWASCNSILSSRPSGTLSEKQMTDVLVDIHLTEATLNITNDISSRLNDTTQLRIRFSKVFIKNKIDPDDFNASLTYYLEHIEELDKIYVEVINQLTELEAKLQPKPIRSNNKLRPGQNMKQPKNVWLKLMYKTDEPEEIQYFDTDKYPIDESSYTPQILNKKQK